MEPFAELWLPILMSAVLVFIVSSILHMVLPVHHKDWGKLPGEDELLEAMRARGVAPGQYMFPRPATMKEMASPEMQAKYRQGPVGTMIVLPNGPPAIGKSLVQWFGYSVLVGIFVGYAGAAGLSSGADFGAVFQLCGTVAILGYAFSYIPDSIWKGLRWSTTLKFVFDGVVYGVVTGLTFAWLWPGGA